MRKTPTAVNTPTCDKLRAIGGWNPKWEPDLGATKEEIAAVLQLTSVLGITR